MSRSPASIAGGSSTVGSGEDMVERVRAFFTRWERSYEELRQSHLDLFADDCVWSNAGFPTTHGPHEAVTVMVEGGRRDLNLDTIKVDIRHIAASGDVVWSERVDHLRRPDGSVIASVPLVGVMEFGSDGLIHRWTEYFDPRPMFEVLEREANGRVGGSGPPSREAEHNSPRRRDDPEIQ